MPGAGYESVLFTLQDGHLIGWFGEPGGPKYVLHAGPDGEGTLSVEVGPTGDWCGVGVDSRDGLERVRDAAGTADRPVPVASESNDNRLDILVLYTGGAERFWRSIGGPAVGIQQLADYLNMAFRDGAISATADLIPQRWEPKALNHPYAKGGHFYGGDASWHWTFSTSVEVRSLMEQYKPDLVFFQADVRSKYAYGAAQLRWDLEPLVHFGWSLAGQAWLFAHEVGHALGGWHDPEALGGELSEYQRLAVRPYAFGHTDLTSCSKREGRGDNLVCPRTIMSLGRGTRHYVGFDSFYSSVRHKPNGWTIGVADEREVERVLHETTAVP